MSLANPVESGTRAFVALTPAVREEAPGCTTRSEPPFAIVTRGLSQPFPPQDDGSDLGALETVRE